MARTMDVGLARKSRLPKKAARTHIFSLVHSGVLTHVYGFNGAVDRGFSITRLSPASQAGIMQI